MKPPSAGTDAAVPSPAGLCGELEPADPLQDTAPRLGTASTPHLHCGTELKAGENSSALKTQRKFTGGLENPGAAKHKI